MTDAVLNTQTDARGRLRRDSWTEFHDESKTVQSDAHLADIQEILKQFGVVGLAQNLDAAEAQYMDVSEFTDYADMMKHVRTAEQEFMTLPSKIREIFDHDVYKWLDTAHDERRIAARSKDGRADDKPVPVVVAAAPVVAPVATPGVATE